MEIPDAVVESEKYRKINEALSPRRRKKRLYSWEMMRAVESRIPPSVLQAMWAVGWNAFGVYEVVEEEIKREKKNKRRQ